MIQAAIACRLRGDSPRDYSRQRPMTRPSVSRLAVLALLVAALGCGTPKLDSSQLEKSIARVRKSVDKSRRADFDMAVKTVQSASRGELEGTQPFSLDGMTAEAIFAEAEKIGLRRDLVWAERGVESERQVVDARAYLDRLRARGFSSVPGEGGQVQASFEVENGLDTAIDSAWIRIETTLPDGRVLSGEDLVAFQPRLKPGERRGVRILVTSEASRLLAEEPNAAVTTHFTMVELDGNLVAQEPTPEALEKARRQLAEAERRRDEIRAKLGG